MPFNFLQHSNKPTEINVRTRATARDPHAGLRGHDYIKARGLNKQVKKVHTSAQTSPTKPEGNHA